MYGIAKNVARNAAGAAVGQHVRNMKREEYTVRRDETLEPENLAVGSAGAR